MEVQLFHTTLSLGVLIFIMAGGFLAGFVDSIAGGGGLVSLPVLMAADPELAVARGTGIAINDRDKLSALIEGAQRIYRRRF